MNSAQDNAAVPGEAGKPVYCLACGTPIMGPYCHACGQKNDDCRRSIVSLAAEVVRDTAALDGRFARTCKESIITPGGHLRQYAHGRRSPFTPPVRFFFVILFVFFATLWVTDRNIFVLQLVPVTQDASKEDIEDDSNISFQIGTEFDEVLDQALETVKDDLPEDVVAQLDDVERLADLPDEAREALGPENIALLEQVAEQDASRPRIQPYGGFFLKARDLTYTEEEREWVRSTIAFDGDANIFGRPVSAQRLSEALVFTMQYPAAFNNALNEAIPVLLLLFVPLMAFLGAIFIRGKDALIYDHLLLSIQTHAFAFVLLILTLITSGFVDGSLAGLIFLIGVPAYYLISAKGAFGRSWRKTTAATIFIGMVYNSFFFIGLLMALLFAFLEIS